VSAIAWLNNAFLFSMSFCEAYAPSPLETVATFAKATVAERGEVQHCMHCFFSSELLFLYLLFGTSLPKDFGITKRPGLARRSPAILRDKLLGGGLISHCMAEHPFFFENSFCHFFCLPKKSNQKKGSEFDAEL
jgi:hypothetical protein